MSLLLLLRPYRWWDRADGFTSVASYVRRKKKKVITREMLVTQMEGRPLVFHLPPTTIDDEADELMFLMAIL